MSAGRDEIEGGGSGDPPESIEFYREPGEDDPVAFTIDDAEIPGVYEVTERGAGFTEEYRAEIEQQSGGSDHATEPPAARIDVVAYADNQTWELLNQYRDRREPFPVSIGPFAYEEMGISSLEKIVRADQQNAIELHIKLKEYREVVIQERDLSATDPGAGDIGVGDGPDAAWVDTTGDGRDDRTGEPIPDMQSETHGNDVITVSSGQAFGRYLVRIADGAAPIIDTTGSNWSVQDVGFRGTYGTSSNTGNPFNIDEMGGSSLMRNIYIGDGAPMYSGTVGVATGTTGAWFRNTSSGHLEGRFINVAGFPDNGLYWSPPANGTSRIADSYGQNNGIGTYRTRHTEMDGCVGVHNGQGHADHGGRVLWVWHSSNTSVEDCDLVVSAGSSTAIVIGEGGQAGTVNVNNSGIDGGIAENHGSTANVTNSRSASAGNYHPTIPGSATDAAAGEATPQGGQQPE